MNRIKSLGMKDRIVGGYVETGVTTQMSAGLGELPYM
jgi:hypothetical protein